jgi:hypothetical protein
MTAPGEFRAEVARAAAASADLATTWSAPAARGLLPPWLRSGAVAGASIAARRWSGHDNQRAAFFNVAFGQPHDQKVLGGLWQPWFDAGPVPPPLPTSAEEAARLQAVLVRRGLVTFSDRPTDREWVLRFLGTALRERTPETLNEVLKVMQARGMVKTLCASSAELAEALQEVDMPASIE